MKIFIILFLFILSGCSKKENEVKPEITTPEIPVIPEVSPEVESNYMHELLINYVFIDVIDITRITLPKFILNEEIKWFLGDEEITTLSSNNNTFNINAVIGEYSKEFIITFNNGIVTSIYQQELKFNYLFITDSKKLGTNFTPSKIVFHNTGNSAAARNEVMYLNSSSNTSSTSFHYAVDDEEIYQAVRTNVYAHHAGNLNVNKQSLGIEIAKSTITNNDIKDKAISNAIKLIKLLQMHYNINDVITHYDVTGKHCPHDIIDRYTLELFYKELEDSYII